MSVPARLTVITLGARDLPRLRAFYEGLGWPVRASTSDWVAFQLGPILLCLYPIELLGAEASPGAPGGPTGWNGVTLAINVESRARVDEVYRDALAAGATAVDPPTDRPYGPRASYVADPEGNRWEIVFAEGMIPDESGTIPPVAPT